MEKIAHSMPRTFCLLNHTLTQSQIAELGEKFNSSEIVYPEKNLSELWSQIPPEKSNEEVVESVVSWLKSNATPGDLFIIQGEFGSTFTLVDFALKNGLVPLYATTKRIAKESHSGETVRREYVFEHVCFKKYQYFEML
ncbi:CRISPR-associated protein Csx20 [uncultured Treponema sp.]|uniref:CRISPR-associated protein Csx20 n=2 Tax=uncultured Treponema sp. TaxID=162155 RepID=UPI0025F442CE|nr:CRISPR-associated protein Csx20 [uncultured Treponema sp.]